MRALCVGTREALERSADRVERVEIGDASVWCAFTREPAPRLEPTSPEDARRVLVHVRAFSCNFRDRYVILKASAEPNGKPFAVGSEFAGEVVAIGAAVTRVGVGDRVMGDNAWPDEEPEGWRRGVPTNHASCEYLLLHEEKLARIPEGMRDQQAAAFSIGAQTAYSMVARLEVGTGSRVMVTAARSNTSLYSIGALRARGSEVYAITGSAHAVGALHDLGVEAVFQVDLAERNWLDHADLRAAARRRRGFDAVVDPFADTNLAKALPFLRFGGSYVTCGMSDRELDDSSACGDLRTGLALAIYKNVHLIANCAGKRSHLEAAMRDFRDGRAPIRVDSVLGDASAAAFLERTFNARDRLGKVVCSYDAPPAGGEVDARGA